MKPPRIVSYVKSSIKSKYFNTKSRVHVSVETDDSYADI